MDKIELFRKRLAKIWGIAPFRIDISTDNPEGQLIQVDGKEPTPEQMTTYQKDVAIYNSRARDGMN